MLQAWRRVEKVEKYGQRAKELEATKKAEEKSREKQKKSKKIEDGY